MSDYEKLFKIKQDDWVKACAQIDRLEAMCEKLAAYISDCNVCRASTKIQETMAEYRAMRDQTKMPCPSNE